MASFVMARTDPQINLRLPDRLKQKLEKAASESGRSTNAEIVWRLESSFSASATFMLIDRRTNEFEMLLKRQEEFELERETLLARQKILKKEKSAAATSEMKIVERNLERLTHDSDIAQLQLDRVNRDLDMLLDELTTRARDALNK